MKKSSTFVSKGTPTPLEVAGAPDYEVPTTYSSHLHPADLPRDYGMSGAVGAYEVKPLAGFLRKTLNALEQQLGAGDSAEALVVAALDRLMPAAERYRLAVESVSAGIITLSLARKGDRYLYNRTLVPKLKTALAPHLGAVRIQLTDRMR